MRTVLTLVATLALAGCQLDQNLGGSGGGTSSVASATGAGGMSSSMTSTTSTMSSTGTMSSSSSSGSSCTPSTGMPVELAKNQHQPHGLGVDADNVYWVVQGDGYPNAAVRKISKMGGAITDLVPGGSNMNALWQPVSVAVAQGKVYWTTVGNLQVGGIWSIPVTGGSATSVADLGSDGVDLAALALGPQTLYTSATPKGGGIPELALYGVPLAGGAPAKLAPIDASSVAVDSSYLYYSTNQGATSTIARIPLSGGAAEVLVSVPNNVQMTLFHPLGTLAVDDQSIYYAEADFTQDPQKHTASLKSVPKAGGMPTTLVTGTFVPGTIVVDAKHLYFTDERASSECGAILAIPKGGAPAPTVVAPGQNYALGLVLDDDTVYWTERSVNADGRLMKVAKLP